MLCNLGETRTDITLHQHFDWKGPRTKFHDVCKKCQTCQRAKKTNQKCWKLPPKQAETHPWDTLCVDLIGPYKIPGKRNPLLKLRYVMMIDPVTGWFEMAQIPDKTATEIVDITKKLGLLVTHFHSKLCLIAVPNLCLNLTRCVKTAMAWKGKI